MTNGGGWGGYGSLTGSGEGSTWMTVTPPAGLVYYDPGIPTVVVNSIKENIEMFKLFDVVLVYGEDRDNLIVERKDGVFARDVEDAKIKSGLMAKVDPKWDADYLTIVAIQVCDVKVKSKPQEVKNV